jgi:hypothetical protein
VRRFLLLLLVAVGRFEVWEIRVVPLQFPLRNQHAFEVCVAMNKFDPLEKGKGSNANKGGYPSMTDVLDERALEYLRQDNAAEIELYRHAQALAATFVSE